MMVVFFSVTGVLFLREEINDNNIQHEPNCFQVPFLFLREEINDNRI